MYVSNWHSQRMHGDILKTVHISFVCLLSIQFYTLRLLSFCVWDFTLISP